MPEIKPYAQGETVDLVFRFTDKDNAAANPSVSKRVRVADPTGTLVVLTGSATYDDLSSDDGTGAWVYAYALASDARIGDWEAEGESIDGDDDSRNVKTVQFKVTKRMGT